LETIPRSGDASTRVTRRRNTAAQRPPTISDRFQALSPRLVAATTHEMRRPRNKRPSRSVQRRRRQRIPAWRFPATFAAKACHFWSISGYYRGSFLTDIHARASFRHDHSDSVRRCPTGIKAGVVAFGVRGGELAQVAARARLAAI
jgi:hypothetical protein